MSAMQAPAARRASSSSEALSKARERIAAARAQQAAAAAAAAAEGGGGPVDSPSVERTEALRLAKLKAAEAARRRSSLVSVGSGAATPRRGASGAEANEGDDFYSDDSQED